MVAQFNSETFAPASHTPEPIPSDPDDVRLALETVKAFLAMGEIGEAVEWLQRAAERAAQAGLHERAVTLLQAMSGLTNRSAPTPRLASMPSPAPSGARGRGFVRPPPTKLPPCPAPLGASLSSLPPPARTSSVLPPPPRKSLPALARKSSLPPAPLLSPVPSVPQWSATRVGTAQAFLARLDPGAARGALLLTPGESRARHRASSGFRRAGHRAGVDSSGCAVYRAHGSRKYDARCDRGFAPPRWPLHHRTTG